MDEERVSALDMTIPLDGSVAELNMGSPFKVDRSHTAIATGPRAPGPILEL
jgi:hypothetical protein